MTHADEVLAYLRSIAPQGATNADLAIQLGIRWHANVYRVTRAMLDQGLIRGVRDGRVWVMYATPDPLSLEAPETELAASIASRSEVAACAGEIAVAAVALKPVPTFTWDINREGRSWQARWLVPLLSNPEGQAWLLERLRCPCSSAEVGAIHSFHFCFPLRDLFLGDYQACRGRPEAEDAFIAYYNDLFGLSHDCGIADVWRKAPGHKLRLPIGRWRDIWRDARLAEYIPERRFRRRAGRVPRLLSTEVDLLMLTPRHVVLVMCVHHGSLSAKRFRRQKMLAGVLERRLNRMYHLGAIVSSREQLEGANVPFVCWDEIVAYSSMAKSGA